MNLLTRLFLFVVLTLALFARLQLAEESNMVEADPFHHGVVSDEQQQLQHAFSAAGASDHVILKASSHGETRTVLDILRHDPDLINHENSMGWSALTFAASNGHFELLTALLNNGANPNHQEKDGWTALMFAAYHGDEETMYALLDHGANPLIRNHREMSAHELARLQQREHVADVLGRQSIVAAVRERDFGQMLFHIEQGISPNVQNPAGWTPLIAAIDAGDFDVVERLLQMGADVNLVERDGWSPLMFAAYRGDARLVQLLLRYGADVALKAHNRESVNTAVEMARANHHDEAVDVLVREGYEARGLRLPWDNHAESHHHDDHEVAERAREQHAEEELRRKRQLLEEEERREREELEREKKAHPHKTASSSSNNKKRGGTGFFNW